MGKAFYDILSGTPRNPCWRATAKGLEQAKQRMAQLAAESPGDYFIFSPHTQEVVARLQSPSAKPKFAKVDHAA